MTLIVETGAGLTTAESYISVADADARHTALGNTAWTGLDAVKEQALRRATQHMEGAYRQRWRGTRLMRAQALSWPRYGAVVDGWAVESTVVPIEVANACADLALRALTDTLAADLTRSVVREKVGPIETEYDRYSPASTRFLAVDMALAPYLMGGAAVCSLVRT